MHDTVLDIECTCDENIVKFEAKCLSSFVTKLHKLVPVLLLSMCNVSRVDKVLYMFCRLRMSSFQYTSVVMFVRFNEFFNSLFRTY